MDNVKKHSVEGLTAYYLKKGRNWWVETEGKKIRFSSIEDMTDEFPQLLKVEALQASVTRRKIGHGKPVEIIHAETAVLTKDVKCYYCSGSGIAGVLPCSNCDGSGKVTVTAEL